jgi:hypothetical protein
MAPRLTGARDGLHRRLRRARCDAGRRGRRRRDRAAGRWQNHRLPHHGVAACRPAAARRGTGRLTHRRTPGRLAADRRRIARVAADRGTTCPPMMPMATRLGVPRNRHHSHAGERSNQPQKDLASHGRNPSRGPRDDRRCPDTGQPVPRARNGTVDLPSRATRRRKSLGDGSGMAAGQFAACVLSRERGC